MNETIEIMMPNNILITGVPVHYTVQDIYELALTEEQREQANRDASHK